MATNSVIPLMLMLMLTVCDSSLPLLELNKFVFGDLNRVCHNSFSSLSGAYADHDMELDVDGKINKPTGITNKPARVSMNSPCYGMSSTCCLAVEEKRMHPLVELTYHKQLQSVLERRLSTCNRLGRNTERVLYPSIKQARDIVEKDIAASMDQTKIPTDVFDKLFQVLYEFIHVPDFCKLSNELHQQMGIIFDLMMNVSTNSSLHRRADDCAKDYKKHFISVWYNDTLNSFVETFNVVRIISEVFQLSEKLLKDLKQHKFNRDCVNSLFRLKHCSFCVGNRIDITVCDGLCLNTFRGCMAEVYMLQPHFKALQEQLHNIMILADSELKSDTLTLKTMIGFKYMIKHMQYYMNNDKNLSTDSCSINEDKTLLSQIVSEVGSTSLTHRHNNNLHSFREASKAEMSCYNDAINAVGELDEEICNVNPKHFKYLRNKGCWNGTHSKGSYNEPLAGKSLTDQWINPTIRRSGHNNNTISSYIKRISQINNLINEVNKTRQFYECLETDDEDCHLFVLECKRITDPKPGIETGSGSGSGSGQMSTDAEFHTSTIWIQLGGPRKFNEMMTIDKNEEGGSNATITDNEEDIKYSSNNNSSDESVVYDRVSPTSTVSPTHPTDHVTHSTTSSEPSINIATPTTTTTPTNTLLKQQGSSASVFTSSVLVTMICCLLCYIISY